MSDAPLFGDDKTAAADAADRKRGKNDPAAKVDGVVGDQIRAFIERIERLTDEKQAFVDDIKEVYAEAKGNGFDTKVLRQIVRIRKQDAAERGEVQFEQEALLELYLTALGMQAAGGCATRQPLTASCSRRRKTRCCGSPPTAKSSGYRALCASRAMRSTTATRTSSSPTGGSTRKVTCHE
jgi:uncharacterized protein (UPF0335 family)